MNLHEGNYSATGFRFAIISTRFNDFIVNQLVDGALDCLKRHNCPDENVEIFKVPGAFEIPVMADRVLRDNKFDAVICLGAVIRGATPHFEYVSSAASNGISQVSLKYGKPVIFGVLTTDTIEQAMERAGTKAGNKGKDSAMAAIEMANLFSKI
ncbi:MAG: 6,7-dimethyl-8-ribityllumazine synthase [Ignavibacteriales bacterium]|nr:MAG: 6,7-dimethyl-8-ribityllumazine synthase [Ignavibacteriales bacterium]